MRIAAVAIAVALIAVAGCGGGSEEVTEPLRDGVYEYELSEEYLLENGITAAQAEEESGIHQTTLENGSFIDSWETDSGTTGSCRGTYEADGSRVTFKWDSGCTGDWAMSYTVNGDEVTWDDIEALPPWDSDADQKINEVFNSDPWTRTGDVPAE